MLAVSCAVALAGSQLTSHPLFLYLSPLWVPRPASPSPTPQIALTVDVCPESSAVENTTSGTGTHVRSNSRSVSLPVSPLRSSSRSLSLPIPPPPSNPPHKYSMPLPVTAMLGQSTGKLKVREFSVCPLPSVTVPQQIKMLDKLHYELGKILAAKLGVSTR